MPNAEQNKTKIQENTDAISACYYFISLDHLELPHRIAIFVREQIGDLLLIRFFGDRDRVILRKGAQQFFVQRDYHVMLLWPVPDLCHIQIKIK